MKLIVGLGNPGITYKRTRHNAGFMVVDELAKNLGTKFKNSPKLQAEVSKTTNPKNQKSYILAKPQTFMNLSGKSVRTILDFYKLKTKDLILIYDDLDLELGKYKIQKGSYPKNHNGVNSVIQSLDSLDDFVNVRVGIDGRNGDRSISSEKYVVQRFSQPTEEKEISRIVKKIVQELLKNSL